MNPNRRQFIEQGAALVAGAGLLLPSWGRGDALPWQPAELPKGAIEGAELHALPGKRPLLKRTYRPPNYETPLFALGEDFTANDAFFVRYHLSFIPQVKLSDWRLAVSGDAAERPLLLSMNDLRRGFEEVEIAACCQCAGSRRGLFSPHVPGVQWGYGAMGNARFRGVRLRDVLRKAGVKAGAVEVAANGADAGVAEKTPDFVKSLPLWKAQDENTLICWEMNGQPLPQYNGFPARLVVPGWAATYWMKHVQGIEVRSQPLTSFWMKSAYRIPVGKFAVADDFPTQRTEVNTPITELLVNSLFTSTHEGETIPAGRPRELSGVAWDGGHGIRTVEVSTNGGKTWRPARLGQDQGRFSWRRFRYTLTAPQPGKLVVMARATNQNGATQGFSVVPNPAGYHHNRVQELGLNVT